MTGLMYSGGENAARYNTIAMPAPRGHVPQMQDKRTGEKGGGYMLMKPLVETATRSACGARTTSGCSGWCRDATGGSPASSPASTASELAIRARRGMVLATGSFAYNE